MLQKWFRNGFAALSRSLSLSLFCYGCFCSYDYVRPGGTGTRMLLFSLTPRSKWVSVLRTFFIVFHQR